jgi:putative transposase
MWNSHGQQVMNPPPSRPYMRYGLGALNYYMGETVVLFRRRKHRREVPELLQAVGDTHLTGTIYAAWDDADTHADDEVETVVRAASGRLVLLYLPTNSPWLHPIEVWWRHFRPEVIPDELSPTLAALLQVAQKFFDRNNQCSYRVLSIVGALHTLRGCTETVKDPVQPITPFEYEIVPRRSGQ